MVFEVVKLGKDIRITIAEATIDDVESMTRMHVQSWLDTYVSPENGVTERWIKDRLEPRLTPEGIDERKRKFIETSQNPSAKTFVAKNDNGDVIGFASPIVDEEGKQQVGALYVDKEFHGTGVAGMLMQKVLEWADQSQPIYLEVTDYNDRAIAFYNKWGFKVVDGSKKVIKFEKMPVIEMIRRGDEQ